MEDINANQPPLTIRTKSEIIGYNDFIYSNNRFWEILLEDSEWNITNISVLLNEMRNWQVHKEFKMRNKYDDKCLVFSFIRFDEMAILKIYVRLTGGIIVKILYVAARREWEIKSGHEFIKRDKRGRLLKKPKLATVIYHQTSVSPTTDNANLFYQKKMSIFYNVKGFSDIFIYFCRKTAKRISPTFFNDSDVFIDVYETWLKKEEIQKFTTEKNFMQNCEGFLKLQISGNLYKDKVHVTFDEIDYSIISGIYISPYAEEIFKRNGDIIDGILLDTTWKLIPCYVTSILMLSVCNVGIPVAFSFGDSENTDIYDQFFKVFMENYSIDLSKFVIESDQGKALTAICTKYNCTHIGCLKHLITSLGLGAFSKQVSELVSAKCTLDYETLKRIYSEKFANYIESDMFTELEKTLSKVGLHYNVDTLEIEVANFVIWDKFSQVKRIDYAMPSTTNALESSHGHLNKKTPRRNDFWSAMMRLVKFVIRKESNFETAFKNNYSRVKRLIQKKLKTATVAVIKQQEYYQTTNETCLCGETKLLSKMFRTEIPCTHVYQKSRKFPTLPDIKLEFSKSTDELILITEDVTVDYHKPDLSEDDKNRFKAVKVIRRFSHNRNENAIRADVSSIVFNEEFANGMPTEYHGGVSDLIIKYFRKK